MKGEIQWKPTILTGPTVARMQVQTLADYDPSEAATVAARVCPILQRVLDSAVGADKEGESAPRPFMKQTVSRKRKRAHLPLPMDLIDSSEDECSDLPKAKSRWEYRGPRAKKNVSSALLLMALFGRSSQCNFFQQVMAITLDAARIPKRPLELLSRAGACVSVDSVHVMAKALADDTIRISRQVLQRPDVIENLNYMAEKRDKSATNRNSMMAAVAGTFYIIDDKFRVDPSGPCCSAKLFQCIFGDDLPRPTHSQSPASPLDANGRPVAMNRKLRDEARQQFLNGSLNPYDFILDLHLECSNLRNKIPRPPQVLPLDEGSVMGNIKVIESIVKDFDLNDEWVRDHIIPAIGDAFTATLQLKAIERREDDRSARPDRDQLDFLQPWAAFFHLQFAYQKFLLKAHSGTASDMTPGGRAGFNNLTTGTVDFHDVDAFLHLYFAAMSEVVISSALRRDGHGDGARTEQPQPPATRSTSTRRSLSAEDEIDGLDDEQSDDDDDQPLQVDSRPGLEPNSATESEELNAAPIREEQAGLPEGGQRDTRHSPSEFASTPADAIVRAAKESIKALLTGNVLQAAGPPTATMDENFAHSISLLRDIAVYIELRHSVKHGDPGRVMAMLRQALPRFQAGGHHRYVVECLEMLMSVRFKLPVALKQVMLASTLVNHSGKDDTFLAADLDIEHMVHDLKHVFPVQGKAGGHERQRRIGELLPLLRGCKAQLFRAFSISSLDSAHAQRDLSLTCRLLASDLEAFALFERQHRGRKSPVFELKFGDKRAESDASNAGKGKKGSSKSKQAKHVTTDTVVHGTSALIGSSTKPGTIEAYFAKKRLSRAPGVICDDLMQGVMQEEDELDFTLSLDVERDMGGFMRLDLDIV
ncbi:hypothetical protein V8E36_002811 [Tilletia maclaganii]